VVVDVDVVVVVVDVVLVDVVVLVVLVVVVFVVVVVEVVEVVVVVVVQVVGIIVKSASSNKPETEGLPKISGQPYAASILRSRRASNERRPCS
jgi:hypothetical protein